MTTEFITDCLYFTEFVKKPQCRTVKLLARNITDGRGSYNLLISGKLSWSSSIQESTWLCSSQWHLYLFIGLQKNQVFASFASLRGGVLLLIGVYIKSLIWLSSCFHVQCFHGWSRRKYRKTVQRKVHEDKVNLKGKSKTTE